MGPMGPMGTMGRRRRVEERMWGQSDMRKEGGRGRKKEEEGRKEPSSLLRTIV